MIVSSSSYSHLIKDYSNRRIINYITPFYGKHVELSLSITILNDGAPLPSSVPVALT